MARKTSAPTTEDGALPAMLRERLQEAQNRIEELRAAITAKADEIRALRDSLREAKADVGRVQGALRAYERSGQPRKRRTRTATPEAAAEPAAPSDGSTPGPDPS